MNRIEIPEKNIVKDYPACWEEHTAEQHNYVLQQLLKMEDGMINYVDFRVLVLYNFLEIEYKPLDYEREKRMLPDQVEEKYSNLVQLIDTIDYFFIEDAEKKQLVINYKCVKNLIPAIKPGNYVYYGPEDAFQNMSFREVMDAVNFHELYIKSHDEMYLNRLIAILYRPEKDDYAGRLQNHDFDGERRIKYNPALNEMRSMEIKRIPFYVKFGILLYFTACWEHITSATIEMNGVPVNLSTLFGSGDSENPTRKNLGLIGLMFKLSETGIFGNVDQVAERNIYDVLALLWQQHQEYQEMKRKLKRHDKN